MHMMNSAKDAKVNSKKNKGLPEITDYLADYVLLNKKMEPASEDTIRRELVKNDPNSRLCDICMAIVFVDGACTGKIPKIKVMENVWSYR